MAKNFWDEFKDLFKTDSQREEERQKQLSDAMSRESEILGELYELDREYRDSLPKDDGPDYEKLFPSDSGLKEIEYEAESDDEIVRRAQQENALGKYRDTASVNDRYTVQKSALESSRQNADKSLKNGYEQLAELYDQLRSRAENDALKRGVARSSIATSALGDLDAARMKGAGELRASYNSTVGDIDQSIQRLEAEKNSALDELDIKYAVELDERISELKRQRDDTVKKYEQYNADVRKKNKEYAMDRQKKMSEYAAAYEKEKLDEAEQLAKYEKKYGYTGEKRENYDKRYDIAYDFYSSLSPDIAADALEASPNMKYYLGAYHYDILLKALRKKADSVERRF